jgi:hypothetical protein
MAVGARVDGPQHPPGGSGSVRPTRPELTGVQRYMAMVLCFRWFLLLRNRWSVRNSPRGSSTGGGSRAGCAVAKFKPQPSPMVGKCSKGRLMTRFDQTGVARNVEHRCWIDGAQGASHMAWR